MSWIIIKPLDEGNLFVGKFYHSSLCFHFFFSFILFCNGNELRQKARIPSKNLKIIKSTLLREFQPTFRQRFLLQGTELYPEKAALPKRRLKLSKQRRFYNL